MKQIKVLLFSLLFFSQLHPMHRLSNFLGDYVIYFFQKATGTYVNDFDEQDFYGQTTLHKYILNNYKTNDMLTMILEAGADPNIQDNTGSTALHYAVQKNNVEAIMLLLHFEANQNIKDNFGQTPINFATGPEIQALFSAEN